MSQFVQTVAGTSGNQLGTGREPVTPARLVPDGPGNPVGVPAPRQPADDRNRTTAWTLTVPEHPKDLPAALLPKADSDRATTLDREWVRAIACGATEITVTLQCYYLDARLGQALRHGLTRCERAGVPLTLVVRPGAKADYADSFGLAAPRWAVVEATE